MPVMIGLDIGIKRDSTAIVVVNGEKDNGVRVDDHKIFLPAPGQPVDLERVEQVLLDYKKKYPNCMIIYDPREMELMAQRLKRLGIRTEEFLQTPSALSALTQNLYDLIRYQRLEVYPNERLRNSVINCVVEEKTTGQRLIRNRSQAKDTHVDVVIALGMAALRCVERHTSSIDWAYKYRAFDPNFQDEDVPPIPPEQRSSANENLLNLYRSIDNAIKWGLIR
jgi:hypothetical protein